MKIKRKYDRIIEKATEVDDLFFLDLLVDIVGDRYRDELRNILISNYDERINELENLDLMKFVVEVIVKHKEGYKEIINFLNEKNKKYVKNYIKKFNKKQLREEFDRDLCPSMHLESITPDMYLFYYYCQNIFIGDKIEFGIKEYKKKAEKMQKFVEKRKEEEKEMTINKEFSESNIKTELSLYMNEEFEHDGDISEIDFDKIAKKYNGKYKKETKTFEGPRGILLFLRNNIEAINKEKQEAHDTFQQVSRMVNRINYYVKDIENVYKNKRKNKKKVAKLKKKNKKLEDKNKELKKNIKVLEKDIEEKTKDKKDKKIKNLEKENYHLKTRIEKLQRELENTKKQQEMEESIEKNINIETKNKTSYNFPQFKDIVILGGKWPANKRQKVQNILANNNVEFINVEDILKKRDYITNSDLVIFDTSRNSHKAYNTIKNEIDILHINRSQTKKIKELFVEK